MNSDEAAVAVIDALEALRIPYMMVGSFSTNFYGVPRATQDVDFVVQLEPDAVSALAKRLNPKFRLDRQMSFETVTATTRYVLHLTDQPFSVELFLLTDDVHDVERFARRRRKRVVGRDVSIISVEDVIVTKLRWACAGRRDKDIEDIRNVIAVQGDCIDWDHVNAWCERHDTRELLESIRSSLRPEQT